MTYEAQAIAEFWRVFQGRAGELARVRSADDPVYDLILDRLQEINPELYFEFYAEPGASELVITAEGERSLFPLVDSIVAGAPEIPGWAILALKPKLGIPVTATWEDGKVTVADVVFLPLELADSDDLGLRLLVPGLAPEHAEAAHNALLRVLDHVLGEREFAESVEYTEVVPLPGDASEEDYIALSDLESYISWRKNRSKDSAN